VGGTGASQIPIFGLSGDHTNFECHWFTSATNGLDDYYARGCWKVDSSFPHDPGQNWKLSYNYVAGAGFVTWMRPRAGGNGFEPCLYNAVEDYDLCNTESLPTFYVRDHKDEWFCLEWYTNPGTSTARMWLSTENGEYDDTLYADSSYAFNAPPYHSFKIGSYWDGGEYEGAYYWLDEVVISETKIGPPTEWTGVQAPVCGDGVCNGDEDCTNCSQDCPTGLGDVCCSGVIHTGDCCTDIDCTPPDVCDNTHTCHSPPQRDADKVETFDDPARYPSFNDGDGFFEGSPATELTHSTDCFSGRCVEVTWNGPGEAWCGFDQNIGPTDYYRAQYYLKIHADHAPNDLKWMRFYQNRFSGDNFLLKIRHDTLNFQTEMLNGDGNSLGTFSFREHIDEWHKVTVEADNSERTFKVWVDDVLDIDLTNTDANDFSSIQGSYYSFSGGSLPVHYSIDEYSITTCETCGPVCGDGFCEGEEVCDVCVADCGACSIVCAHDADEEPCDGVVSITELIAYINRWIAGEVSLNDVVGAIVAWKG